MAVRLPPLHPQAGTRGTNDEKAVFKADFLKLLRKNPSNKKGGMPTPGRVKDVKAERRKQKKETALMDAAAALERQNSLQRFQQLAGSCSRSPSDGRAEAFLQVRNRPNGWLLIRIRSRATLAPALQQEQDIANKGLASGAPFGRYLSL